MTRRGGPGPLYGPRKGLSMTPLCLGYTWSSHSLRPGVLSSMWLLVAETPGEVCSFLQRKQAPGRELTQALRGGMVETAVFGLSPGLRNQLCFEGWEREGRKGNMC